MSSDNSINSYLNQKNKNTQEGFSIRDLYSALLRRKKLFSLLFVSFFVYSVLSTIHKRYFSPVYLGTFSLMIKDPVGSSDKRSLSPTTGQIYENLAINSQTNDVPTLIGFLKSPLVLKETADKFNLSPLQLSDQVKIIRGTRNSGKGILKVRITGQDKKTHKDLVDSIVKVYLQAALDFRQKRLTDGLTFLEKQYPQLQSQTASLEEELSVFRLLNNVVDPTEDAILAKEDYVLIENVISNLKESKDRIIKIKKDLKNSKLNIRGFEEAIDIANSYVKFRDEDGGFKGVKIEDNSKSLLNEGLILEKEIAKARIKFTENSKTVQGLNSKLNKLKPLLLKTQNQVLDTALDLNKDNLDIANLKLQETVDRIEKLPQLIKEYNNIIYRLKFSRERFQGLLSAQENFQLELAQNSVPWTIISGPYVEDIPVNAPFAQEIPKGIILGILFAGTLAFLRDFIDYVYHSPLEVKDDIGYTLIGNIPYVNFFRNARDEKKSILTDLNDFKQTGNAKLDKQNNSQRFFYQEAFRNIYTSLRFLNINDEVNVFTLTSSIPSEGKSQVNILLSKTLSELGEKILLIDADLRKPQIDTRLGLDNFVGLSNVLTDNEIMWKDVLQKVDGFENWDVMTAGLVPPDPTLLLGSERMKNLIKEIKNSKKYTYVIIDSPPVLGLADASITSSYCNGTILIVSLNQVKRSLPKQSIQTLISNKSNFLGVITNNLKKEKREISEYGAAYSYAETYNTYKVEEKIEESEEEPNSFKSAVKKIVKKTVEFSSAIFRWLDN